MEKFRRLKIEQFLPQGQLARACEKKSVKRAFCDRIKKS